MSKSFELCNNFSTMDCRNISFMVSFQLGVSKINIHLNVARSTYIITTIGTVMRCLKLKNCKTNERLKTNNKYLQISFLCSVTYYQSVFEKGFRLDTFTNEITLQLHLYV